LRVHARRQWHERYDYGKELTLQLQHEHEVIVRFLSPFAGAPTHFVPSSAYLLQQAECREALPRDEHELQAQWLWTNHGRHDGDVNENKLS